MEIMTRKAGALHFAAPAVQKQTVKGKAKMPQQKLRQTSTGRIYMWSKALAARHDMVPWPPATTAGLVEPGAKEQLIEMEFGDIKYRISKEAVKDFNDLCQSHVKLMGENEKLAADLQKSIKTIHDMRLGITGEFPTDTEGTGDENDTPEDTTPLDDGNRNENILQAMDVLAKSGDVDKFAGNGMPKVQALEEVTKFNLTAQERNELWEQYQASVK